MIMPARCFSRSGWWQTLCGRDSANQGFGWADKKKYVGCKDCKRLIKMGEHRRWKSNHIFLDQREGGRYVSTTDGTIKQIGGKR